MVERALKMTYRTGRKLVVGVVGTTVLALGIVMIVLPGPAFLIIPLGLGILGAEFAWARRFLRGLREGSEATLDRLRKVIAR